MRAKHILIKHQQSRRLASWKDPNGVEIKARTQQDADAELEKLLVGLRSGSLNFEETASKVSDCGSAQEGGDLGEFGPGEMMKPFEDALLSLKVGEISGVVHTDSGSHLILRTG